MSSFFVVPSFAPATLEQLHKEPDEVAIIVAQEAKITQELAEVREHNRDAEPLGVIAAQEDLESVQDDGLNSDAGLTEEEDDLEDEEEGDTDIGEQEDASDDGLEL